MALRTARRRTPKTPSETAATRYASEQKAWREHLGLDQKAFARALGFSQSLVESVEQCKRTPTVPYAERCDEVTKAPGTFVRWQAQIVEASYPSFFAPVVEFERDAVRIHGWEIGAVPGLLQTEGYTRSIVRAGRPAYTETAVARTVSARTERQGILLQNPPPMLWYVIHEGVLRHRIGGVDIMAEQLDQLIELAARPSIVIQILPFTAEDHAGAEGPITVYDLNENRSVGYAECNGGGRIIETDDEVADLLMMVNLLRASSLPVRESAALMREIRSEMR